MNRPRPGAAGFARFGLLVLLALGALILVLRELQPPARPAWPAGTPPMLSDFHSMRGVGGGRRSQRHQGIDFAGPAGQPVIAAADGVVLAAMTERCWGPTIMIDHGRAADRRTRLVALYGHVEEMLVVPGQRVTRGQTIARLGDSYRRFDCISGVRHLHFQLGQRPRTGDRSDYWGHMHFLEDGLSAINPHHHWVDGPNRPTCFDPSRTMPAGRLTLPMPCHDPG